MSKRCPDCGAVNEDSRIYCSSCGEPLDAELRLIKSLEKQKKAAPAQKAASEDPAPAPKKKAVDDGDYDLGKMSREKKSSPLPWIVLGVIVVAAAIAILVLR